MTDKTGTTVAGMQTEGGMTAAVDTGAKAGAPERKTSTGAADMTIVIIIVVTESMSLGSGMIERNAETEASCVITAPRKMQAERIEVEKKEAERSAAERHAAEKTEAEETEAETTAALVRGTAASQAPPATPRKARSTLNEPYPAMQR